MIIPKIILYAAIIGYLIYAIKVITDGKELRQRLLFTPSLLCFKIIVETIVFRFLWNEFTPLISQDTITLDYQFSLRFIVVFEAVKFIVKIVLSTIGSFFAKK